MADEIREQQPEPEQEPAQGEEPAGEPAQEEGEDPQKGEPEQEKKSKELLMPVLYALLAGVGAFTLTLIIGIVVTIFNQPLEDPSETLPAQQTSQVTLAPSPDGAETQPPQEADGEDDGDGTETQPPQGSDGEDGGTEDTPE